MAQLLGVSVNFAWAFGMGFLMFSILDRTIGLRVTPEEEKDLNIVEFADVVSWLGHLKDEHYENLTHISVIDNGRGFDMQSVNSGFD